MPRAGVVGGERRVPSRIPKRTGPLRLEPSIAASSHPLELVLGQMLQAPRKCDAIAVCLARLAREFQMASGCLKSAHTLKYHVNGYSANSCYTTA